MDADLSDEIQRFEAKYAENPDSLLFARLADLHRKAGDAGRALDLLDEGLDRHPDYLSAHVVRARTLRELGRGDEAERVFERVLRMDSENLVALRSLGELALERGDRGEARRRFEALLELDPRSEEIRERLGELRDEEGATPPARDAPSGSEPATGPGRGGGQPGAGDEGPGEGPGGLVAPEEEAGEPAGAKPSGGSWWDRAAGGGDGEEEGGEPDETQAPGEGAGGRTASPEEGSGRRAAVFDIGGPERGAPEAGRDEDDPGEATEGGGGEDEAGPGDEPASSGDEPDLPGPGVADAGDRPAAREEAEFLGLGRDAAAGEPDGTEPLPAEEDLGERVRELSEEGGGAAAAGAGDEDDLLTETLASLYETQGFYEEAVEMYEELLRQRPGDEALRRRLEDARDALGTTGEAPERPEAGEGAGGSGEPAGPPPASAAPAEKYAPGAGDPGPSGESAARGDGETVRDHLRALLRGEAGSEAGRGAPGSGA